MHLPAVLSLHFFFFLLIALVLGSFSSALIYRVPLGLSWWRAKGDEARSSCPSCGTYLKALNLIPIFSWLFQRGRCASCDQRISFLYPLSEVSCVLAGAGIYLAYGFSPLGFLLLALVPFLVALLYIDIQHMILPNSLMIVMLVGGLLFQLYFLWEGTYDFACILLNYFGAAFVYAFSVWSISMTLSFVLKKSALGMGDVKFFFIAGLFLGISAFPVFCFLSGVLGVLFGLLWRVFKGDGVFPFGPALIVSFFVILIAEGPYLENSWVSQALSLLSI